MKSKKLLKKLLATALAVSLAIGSFQFANIKAEAKATIDIGSTSEASAGIVKSYNISVESDVLKTNRRPSGSYSASTPNMVTIVDYHNWINVAYSTGDKVVIKKYNTNGDYESQISINKKLPKFGNITCDDKGNYYVVTGQDDETVANVSVINIAKYDYSGNFISACDVKSMDTGMSASYDDYWGTQYPFHAGNCQIAYNKGYLCLNYGRKMFSGHQSNHVIYVDASTMKRVDVNRYSVPYMSHSFDQRVIPTSDGNFLLSGHGDAIDRGFCLWKVNTSDNFKSKNGYHFYFREGASRSYGYNETFAQLGGITETSKSYVFCGSSEKTLSFDKAPSTSYMGHNEARNLFVQFINKDFTLDSYGGFAKSSYTVQGETRVATGTYEGRSRDQEYRLIDAKEAYVNYGVIWLTDYDSNHYAANPKILTIDKDQVLVMWEERSYSTSYYDEESVVVFYTVLSSDGKVVTPVKRLDDVRLVADQDLVYLNNSVYWATNDEKGARLNRLILDKPVDEGVAEKFVRRLYKDCLGREAEEAGLKAWKEQLCNKTIDGASIGAGFVFSEEYMSKETTKTEYIKMLYKVFMGREADEAGLKYWKNEMMKGMSREEVFKGFVDSNEYIKICSDSGIVKGTYAVKGIADRKATTGVVTKSITDYVERIYDKALNRGSDPEGIKYWSEQIANEEWDSVAVAKFFIISKEFEAKKLNDEEYVKVLYRTFMGREFDKEGLNYWLQRLYNGDTRETVLESFAGCPEFQDIVKSFGL